MLAGGDSSDASVALWAAAADVLYAADSAANRLVRLGFKPTVVGDLDSFDPDLKGLVARIVRDVDPDRTDCDKMVALIESEGHSHVTVLGLEGDRLDHMMASLGTLARSRLEVTLVLRGGLGHLVRPQSAVHVTEAFGRGVSFMPVTRCTGASLSGCLWEFEGAVLEIDGFVSVSNEGTGTVAASVETGCAVLFVSDPAPSP